MEIKDIRKNVQPVISETEMAKYLGISVSAYCNKEKGRRKFTANEAVLLIKYAAEHAVKVFEEE